MSEPASQNPYMYCKGNPVKYSDPSGYYQMSDKDKGVNKDFTAFVMNMASSVSGDKKEAIMRLAELAKNSLIIFWVQELVR